MDRYEPIADSIAALNPSTAAQKDAVAAANLNIGLMEQTRIPMSLQLASPVTWLLLIIVVAWAMFLFWGSGCFRAAIQQPSPCSGWAQFRWPARFS